MTASVPPDREAAVQQVAEARSARWHADHEGTTFSLGWFLAPASMEAEDWWPLIRQAREDGKAEGRRDAAEAIEWVRAHYPTDVFPEDSQSADAQAARFARTICATITGILARGAQQHDEKERTDGQ